MPLTTLAKTAHASLSKLAHDVRAAEPSEVRTFTFRTIELHPDREPLPLVDAVGKWAQGDGRFVYYFELEGEGAALERLHSAVALARGEKRGDRKYARLFAPSRILYVGGSSKLRTRFREHLGYGHRSVYAMQLAHWATICDVQLRFTAARYPAEYGNDVLGALEDQLWMQLSPMLGRQGRT